MRLYYMATRYIFLKCWLRVGYCARPQACVCCHAGTKLLWVNWACGLSSWLISFLFLFAGGPSENELLDLSFEITSFWYSLGIRLGLTSSFLNNINHNVGFQSPQEKAFQMLLEWSHRQTKSGSMLYEDLSQALRKTGNCELAQKHCGREQVNRWLMHHSAMYARYYTLNG